MRLGIDSPQCNTVYSRCEYEYMAMIDSAAAMVVMKKVVVVKAQPLRLRGCGKPPGGLRQFRSKPRADTH